jgi:biopolymer transport protein ExbD
MCSLHHACRWLLLAAAGLLVASCARRESRTPFSPYAGIHLPKAAESRCEDYSRLITVCVSSSGVVSIARNEISGAYLATILKKVVADNDGNPDAIPVHVAADMAAPFESVWTVLDACRKAGIVRAGLVVTDDAGTGYNALQTYLPDMESVTNLPAEQSARITITVSPHVFTVDGKPVDASGLRARLQALAGALPVTNQEVIVIASAGGVSYGQFMLARALCRELRLENVAVLQGKDVP